jgi:hypothetical protein
VTLAQVFRHLLNMLLFAHRLHLFSLRFMRLYASASAFMLRVSSTITEKAINGSAIAFSILLISFMMFSSLFVVAFPRVGKENVCAASRVFFGIALFDQFVDVI